ncbi:MAG: hypothetical protein IKP88_14545 [Lachnospiraceae bacterium]|nr:hypothetical protein [Lachnospiraceae bacterium]
MMKETGKYSVLDFENFIDVEYDGKTLVKFIWEKVDGGAFGGYSNIVGLQIGSYVLPCSYEEAAEYYVPSIWQIGNMNISCSPHGDSVYVFYPDMIIEDDKKIELTLYHALKKFDGNTEIIDFDGELENKYKIKVLIDKEKQIANISEFYPQSETSVKTDCIKLDMI